MKYIVTWVIWVTHSVPCPMQHYFDSTMGKGYCCGVVHLKSESSRNKKIFTNGGDALFFYDSLMCENEKALITIVDSNGKEYKTHFLAFGLVDSIKIDSIKINL